MINSGALMADAGDIEGYRMLDYPRIPEDKRKELAKQRKKLLAAVAEYEKQARAYKSQIETLKLMYCFEEL